MNDEMPHTAMPADFAATLFAQTDAQDLAACPEPLRAELAAAAWAHLAAPRPAGQPVIALALLAAVGDVLLVVNDNKPFLLDSTLAELAEQGLDPALVAHPILAVARDAGGRLIACEAAPRPGLVRESLLHIHLPHLDDAARARLLDGLARVYADVAAAVEDWVAMRTRLYAAVQSYRVAAPPLPAGEIAEAIAFLDWIGGDNFIFLGLREYRFPDGDVAADPVDGSGLGLLRDPATRVLRRGRELVTMTPELRAFLARPQALIITKANVKSRVHRRVHLDYIGVKLFHSDGRIAGELRLVGLFTATLYANVARAIPYLRRKLDNTLARAGFDPASYAGRALLAVLEAYPRDELFQVDEDTLFGFAIDILNLSERPRIRVLSRADEFDRFVSVLVFVPKDRYDTNVRRRIGAFLAEIYQGRVSAAYPTYPEGLLARTHYIIGHDDGPMPRPDRATLEAAIAAIVRTWADGLRGAIGAAADYARYAEAFSAAYREAFTPEEATADIAIIAALTEEAPRAVGLHRRPRDAAGTAHLRLFSRGASLPLSDRVPLLENLGFRVLNERTYRITPLGAPEAEWVWLHDMTLERQDGAAIDIATTHGPVEQTLLALFAGRADSDGFNRLVLEAGFGWREAALVRALGRYLRQLRVPFGQDYLAATLARHAGIATAIVALFHARFDPAADRGAQGGILEGIEVALASVENLDDDRILRRFVNLVQAAVRTNFYQRDAAGDPRPTISVKFACAEVAAMPLPRPLFEIFVHCPRVEGLHLRFGRVARGGLRWSDRPQDYRTEVLGLVKAQQVKNAVIVPVGAKGGFVPQRLPPASERVAWLAEGTESYRIFVRSLLELTDNLADGQVVPPVDTVRHDGDDPYFVVAADKGTATFSDIANAISLDHGFWLGDAFASGGSQGYDHKAMGITAKGAWEAVKRHFREIDIDIQARDFTAVGVGDMSGDVFGNGALLSPHMSLIAAFDHRHIFLDPAPDPGLGHAERARLFALPRSSWDDYDRARISPGGGVFPRGLKSIALSPEVRAALDFHRTEATPAELMSAILKAPADLLWFGGIGTYLRASSETDADAADRANDAIRVTGAEVRAKVIGEGANLGATQRGRIEAARAGVRLNTDAIDNAAGVNTSDVEVNIKVALSIPEADGRLPQAERNALLAAMTDEVAALVLRNNYLQTLALSLAQRRAAADLGFARRSMQMLEQQRRLDRAVEFLPDDAALAQRAREGSGLTRPENAILLAYAKLALYDDLLASRIPDDPHLGGELERYFPATLRARFPDAIAQHKLRREIIATTLANAIVNRAGATVVTRLADETGADVAAIATAYAAVRDSFVLMPLNAAIDALDGVVSGAVQLALYATAQDLLLAQMVWFLRHADLAQGVLTATVGRFRDGIAALGAGLGELLPAASAAAWRTRTEGYIAAGVPAALAGQIAGLSDLGEAPDIVLVAERTGDPVAAIARVHFAVAERFRITALRSAAAGLAVDDYYDRLALDRALGAIAAAHRALTVDITTAGAPLAAWCERRVAAVARLDAALDAVLADRLTLSRLAVAAGLLADVIGG
ncbi:MAG: NAD-glutamate dehydrogenase [Alphaproteobacteria bacterium]|nr:NAD-glutamate dehydrogenase [Alphaproteobacteria bacterium]